MDNFNKENTNKTIKIPRFNEANGFYASEKSSKLMRKIRSNNKSELVLRKALWNLGYRYRVNYNKLPGKPDIAFLGKKTAIFIDGDFWHGYNWQAQKNKLKSNRNYWIPKIERNIQRDMENTQKLIDHDYTVLRFWEHEVKEDLNHCVKIILNHLQ